MDVASEERAIVSCTALNARGIDSKTLYALVDVELVVGGVAFVICGVQARRSGADGTSIHLPTYKALDGSWQTAIQLPPELRKAVSDAVLDLLMAEGLSKPRFLQDLRIVNGG